MEDTEAKKSADDGSGSTEEPGKSSSDWFKMKWKKSNKKPTASEDAIVKPPPIRFDDPSLPPLRTLRPLPFAPRNRVYDMSGDKLLVIFNHFEYQQESYYYRKYEEGRPKSREHTDKDVRQLHKVFCKELGFRIEVNQDEKYDDIHERVRMLSEQDHSKTSCVCVVILTHGGSDGEVLAADQPYQLESLVELLQHGNQWLVGKPKLFIVQACRGEKVERKVRLQLDNGEDFSFISTHADTLMLRSSVEGYKSWRDEDGSWLIQELCRVVHATHRDLDFQQMATMVTSLVVYDHETHNTGKSAEDYTKQTPEIRSTLTKLLRFPSAPNAGAETK